ncbi:hypothetical protein BDN70DRAFT_898991 [Pholiota conissans]|uniref:Uncharacterized protein n=1 Tax=Pholiota conissans TaxID=109636 RepID=A0A9P6CPW0_9AGAR|nr:hypothetical protein BDN70DRAFT_898991 [Pholiota conissans]
MEKGMSSDARTRLNIFLGENKPQIEQEEDLDAVLEPLRRTVLAPDSRERPSKRPYHQSSVQVRTILRQRPAYAAVPMSIIVARSTGKYDRRSEILWTGCGCPQKTVVLELTASDGYHNFSGRGTNGNATGYWCTVPGCRVVVSESRR